MTTTQKPELTEAEQWKARCYKVQKESFEVQRVLSRVQEELAAFRMQSLSELQKGMTDELNKKYHVNGEWSFHPDRMEFVRGPGKPVKPELVKT